jgi:LysR family nitrogen assimilation transcriptional regulator
MCLMGAPGGPSDAARERSYSIRDLGDLPLILPSLAHNNRRLVEQAALEHGVRLRIKIEIDSVAFAKAMVEDGLGYTILTYAAVEEEVARGRLAAFAIMRPVLSTNVTLVTLTGVQPRLTEETAAALFGIARDLVRGRRWSGSHWIAA